MHPIAGYSNALQINSSKLDLIVKQCFTYYQQQPTKAGRPRSSCPEHTNAGMRWKYQCAVGSNVPLAGDKAEVEMSKQGIRAMVISALIGLFIWIALISALRELFL